RINAQRENGWRKYDRVGIDTQQILRGSHRNLFAARRNVVEALVHARDQVRQRAAAVRRDDLEAWIAIEKSVIDHPRNRKRSVERETDRRSQLKARHIHLRDAG